MTKASLGLDFGTESVRALLVDLEGRELCTEICLYRHGQIVDTLPTTGEALPEDYAFQHPGDWVEAASFATRSALARTPIKGRDVVGIGVDFTSCTMLPARSDGTPLCLIEPFSREKFSWPKLWKHHGAKHQTERINQLARKREEPWLWRYGGTIGLEWFLPKVLETLEQAPHVFEAADTWLEAGDWFVWQLVGGDVSQLPRSTCQAGYKACWSAADGYPSNQFLAALHPRLDAFVSQRLRGRHCAPGSIAGHLTAEAAQRLGLEAGVPVSAAIIDAHAGVPGVGAATAGTLVMVLGTSSCHMLNAVEEHPVPGVAGIVKDGILPGLFGYETGQSAVGDLFDWYRKFVGQSSFQFLDEQAAKLGPGSDGVLCLDWMNGCRTPLMEGSLRGAFTGLSLYHTAANGYRAAIEATAFGLRWIVELLRDHRVPIDEFVATGGLPHLSPLLIQIYADVLGQPIRIPGTKQGPALGAAILGAMAAKETTKFASATEAIRAMASTPNESNQIVIAPNADANAAYHEIYRRYRKVAQFHAAGTV